MFVKGMKGSVVAAAMSILLVLLCGCGSDAGLQETESEPVQQGVKAVGAYVTIEEEEVPLAAVPKEAERTVSAEAEVTPFLVEETPVPATEVEVLLNKEDAQIEMVVEPSEEPQTAGTASPETTSLEVTGTASPETVGTTSLTEGVLQAVNETRAANGLSGLTTTPELSKAATQRATEIAGSFSHTRPSGNDYHTAVTEAGGSFGSIGENLFRGMNTVESIKSAWSGSSVHLENILNGSFNHVGIGAVQTENGVYLVQIFTD